jgi:DsbC/DsbD-like thiol-disulfide interchange protein
MSRRALFRLVACLLLPASTIVAGAAQVPAKHARVELLSRRQTAVPGSDALLGVRFMLEPGWHIYWLNPGDSGQPPAFKWQLPAGFTAGETQWPRPERMQASPTLADYGYHDDVLLLVPLKVASSVTPGKAAEITLDAKWLICREICIPDHAQLKLSLPVAREAHDNPATAEIFARTEKLLPAPLPKGWRVSAQSLKNAFVLTVHSGKALTRAEFFPLEPDQIDNASPQKLQPLPAGIRITLKKSDLLMKPVSSLRGVLVTEGGVAYQVEASVSTAKAVK